MTRVAGLAFLVVLGLTASASSKTRDVADEVWQGYLFRDGEDRVRLGHPVVARSVLGGSARIVVGALAKRLEPLLAEVDDEFFFWNLTLERSDGAPTAYPRHLVRLRGRIRVEGDEDELRSFRSGETRTMMSGRLLSVEIVDASWLRAWAPFFRDEASPWRTDDRIRKSTEPAVQAFAKRALPALLAMRGLPGAGEEDRARVHRIEPGAQILERFRRSTEWQLQRWLVRLDREQQLGLEGLAALGPLPPAPQELQRWMLEADTKKAFLERVAARWSGSLEPVALPHYVTRGRSTSYTETSLADVSADWTEEDYRRHRKATTEILDR